MAGAAHAMSRLHSPGVNLACLRGLYAAAQAARRVVVSIVGSRHALSRAVIISGRSLGEVERAGGVRAAAEVRVSRVCHGRLCVSRARSISIRSAARRGALAGGT